jgi:hypothetical protein
LPTPPPSALMGEHLFKGLKRVRGIVAQNTYV